MEETRTLYTDKEQGVIRVGAHCTYLRDVFFEKNPTAAPSVTKAFEQLQDEAYNLVFAGDDSAY